MTDIFGTTASSTTSSFSTELFVSGPNANGGTTTFSCDSSSACTINYDIIRTPYINAIYPSTVYSGMDICLNVFTDYSTGGSKQYAAYNKTLIGSTTANFDEYFDDNYDAILVYSTYQL